MTDRNRELLSTWTIEVVPSGWGWKYTINKQFANEKPIRVPDTGWAWTKSRAAMKGLHFVAVRLKDHAILYETTESAIVTVL